MKHIMISIKPEYVCKILNKEKLLEIRKSIPKCILNGEECIIEIYCTKDRNNLCIVNQNDSFIYKTTNVKCCHLFGDGYIGNGKVVARWHLKEWEYFCFVNKEYSTLSDEIGVKTNKKFDYKKACITEKDLVRYAFGNGINPKNVYAWHIEDLHIYDKPKELTEFGLKRPPQSWCYLEDFE